MMRQDSIRLRTGGTAPVQKVSEKSAQSNELLTTRFRRADSTLSRADIRELYFSVDGREDTAPFLSKIEAEGCQQEGYLRMDRSHSCFLLVASDAH